MTVNFGPQACIPGIADLADPSCIRRLNPSSLPDAGFVYAECEDWVSSSSGRRRYEPYTRKPCGKDRIDTIVASISDHFAFLRRSGHQLVVWTGLRTYLNLKETTF